jgi:ATP-dependent exoDNAse (exonuclease V) beta subunit
MSEFLSNFQRLNPKNAFLRFKEMPKKEKIRSAYNAVKPLLENGKAYKEKSFIYNGGKLVQGIIDLLIIRDSGAIVVDYKTTSLYSLLQEKTMLEYQIQVGIYAKAVSEIIGLNVEKVMLYSFEKDDFIELKNTQN